MEWISVNDRLPESGEEILVSNGEEVRTTYFHIWENGSSWGRVPFYFQPVTHWMPLPEPPNEK